MDNLYILKPRLVHRLRPTTTVAGAFDDLTDQLVISQAAAGTLNPAIVEALLAAVRNPAQGAGR